MLAEKCLATRNSSEFGNTYLLCLDQLKAEGKTVVEIDTTGLDAEDRTLQAMPTSGLMPLAEREKIVRWINSGHRFED